jgi:hypothetical protein
MLESCPEGRSLSKVQGMSQNLGAMFLGNPLRLIQRTIVYNEGIDVQRTYLPKNIPKGVLGVIGRDEDTDSV